MALAKLQEEAAIREIGLTRADGRNKTSEELIRDAGQHASDMQAETEWIPAPGPRPGGPDPQRESTGIVREASME
eukprot:3947616-Pyramimonas_sp.AAC.1